MSMNMDEAAGALVEDTRNIAVLRPSGVGDFVFALPALHALRAAYPDARIIYIGKEWHADFLRGRPGPVDEVAVLPPYPGIGAPLNADPAPGDAFIATMRSRRLDIAIQLYGGGKHSNPFIRRLGARVTAGMKAEDADAPDRWVSYGRLQNTRLLLLQATALVGANRLRLGQELEVTERDRREAERAVPDGGTGPLVLIHPSANDPRRHWPPERFAAVADALAEAGASIAVNGTMGEARFARAVIERMRRPAMDMSGRLTLPGLCGLLEHCALVVSNDSGPLHLALAIGAPCVGIYWLTNLYDGGPLQQDRHRAAMALRVHCPVCGMENRIQRCPHDVSFVDDVGVDEVLGLAMELFKDPRRATRP